MGRKLTLEIFRYNPQDPLSMPRMQTFELEEHASMTVSENLFKSSSIIRS